MEYAAFNEISPALRACLIKAYGDLVERIWNETLCDMYLIVIKFNWLDRRYGDFLEQMFAESEHFYRGVLLNRERRTRSIARAGNLPIMIGHPDLPVPKKEKPAVADVRINNGLHMNFILSVPVFGRSEIPFEVHFRENPQIYYGTRGIKREIYVENIDRTRAKAAGYVMKFLGSNQFGLDYPLILPKALSELSAR